MFEAVELGTSVSREAYEKRVPELRQRLLQAQIAAREAGLPVFVVLAGIDKAGKGDVLNLLNEWMDPRWLATLAYDHPSPEELERPRFWRYWRDMPAAGRIALYLSAWYRRPLKEGFAHDERGFYRHLDEAIDFERMLVRDGALILKFWIHLSEATHRARLEELAQDPAHAWRISEVDWAQLETHDEFAAVAERVIARSHMPEAPWILVDGTDPRHRALRVGETLLEAMESRLANEHRPPAPPRVEAPPGSVLDRVDLNQRVDKDTYERELSRLQGRLGFLQRQAYEQGVSTVAVFEGWDAGGKGGSIRRATRALDARQVRVVPIAAPTDEEQARHYLWRFWRHLPRAGRVVFFDRSWYGRVLVERVERFATTGGVAARLQRDQRLRGPARRPRHGAVQVLAAHQQGGAEAAIQRPAQDAPQALEADRGGRAQPQEVERVRGRSARDGHPDQHPRGPLDAGGRQPEEVRAPAGAADALRPAGAAARAGRAGGGPTVIVDAWMQHPTPGFVGHPMFAAIRRWMGITEVPESIPIELTVGALDAAGVDRGVLCGWWGPDGPLIPNDVVAEQVAAAPDRFIGLASVDLMRPMEAVRELRRSVNDLGLRGLRMLPWWWGLPPDDRRYYPLYAECIELGIPFCLQVGHAGPLHAVGARSADSLPRPRGPASSRSSSSWAATSATRGPTRWWHSPPSTPTSTSTPRPTYPSATPARSSSS